MLKKLQRQIKRFAQLCQQKNCRGTAKVKIVFLASASAIILLTAFELKFEQCGGNTKCFQFSLKNNQRDIYFLCIAALCLFVSHSWLGKVF